ncbi:MAG: hypothetical protein C7N36_10860 [Bacteroidetes bacterium]|nr:MAG: hypothetical protein C7N36_10860 [Bacteroidota bacterium]
MAKQRIIAGLFFLLLFSGSGWPEALAAQDIEPGYEEAVVRPREFDAEAWDKLNRELNYSGQPKPPKAEKKPPTDTPEDVPPPPPPAELSSLFKGILVGLLILLLLGLIYAIVQHSNRKNRPISVAVTGATDPENLATLEEALDKTDVAPYLQQAEAAKNYHLAVRLHFLALLKMLHETQHIQWKKDRTNRVYLNQMRAQAGYAEFRALTLVFERVWYGNHFPAAAEYEQIKTQFLAFSQVLQPLTTASNE